MQKARILVVEDDPHLLEGVRAVLELNGYDVIIARDGLDALGVLRSDPNCPDLIVSDIMMPNMDGIELLKGVRRENAWVSIPFIFLTARSEKSDIQRGKQLGVDDYLTKPFEADELLVAVDSRLTRTRALTRAHESELSDLKRRILIILNHEFRTPLTFVVAYADLLNTHQEQALSDTEIVNFLKGVNNGATRLRRLIENFILLVELETGDAQANFDSRKTPLRDMNALLERARRTLFDTMNIKHTVTIHAQDNDAMFVGDPDYIAMALVQLLDNAVKFSKPEQVIEMGVSTANGEIVLWVRDYGRGISEQELERIWDSFYQINRPVYEDQGTGSGLAIVQAIMRLHSGRAVVGSQLGQGSVFSLILPAIPAM